MPLSTKEILLVVSARDQASSAINLIGKSFGGLSQQVTALQNVQNGLQLEKQAMKFDQLGVALGSAKQDYALLGAQVGEVSALKRAGIQVDDEALAAAKVDLAQRRVHITEMQNEFDNRGALIDKELQENAVMQENARLQKQSTQASMGQSIALIAVGAASIFAGVKVLSFYAGAVKQAIDYENAARKTLTQISGFKGSLQEVEDVGLKVAREIPIPLGQIQAGLFDIFSSIPVANMADAEALLEKMAKAAVAGATDLQTVERSNFELINAFGLGVGDLNHVLDVQFKLVQLGIGDYADINTGIGRLAPTAKTAGQSIDTLGGVLAFMTRITGDGSQAITAVQRAMESITNPKVQTALGLFGVTVADSFGNFKPFPQIVTELGKALSGLDPQQKAAAIFDIFRGTGSGSKNTRQFFMAAIDNLGQFNDIVNQVTDNAGAMQTAFDTMSGSTANKIQQFHNDMQAARIEVGEALLPAVNAIIEAITRLFAWFNNLSDSTKKWILIGGLALGIFLVIVGIILVLVGVVGLLAIAFTAAVPVIAAMATAFAIVSGIVLTLVAIGILLWKNWNTIKSVAADVWGFIKKAAFEVWHTMQDFWDWLSSNGVKVWHQINDAAHTAWDAISSGASSVASVAVAIWNVLVAFWGWLSATFGPGFSKIWDTIKTQAKEIGKELGETFGPFVDQAVEAWQATDKIFHQFVAGAKQIFSDISGWFASIADDFARTGQWIWDKALLPMINFFQQAWTVIDGIVETLLPIIEDKITTTLIGIQQLWNEIWPAIEAVIKSVWDQISQIISDVIVIISNIIQLFLNIIQGDWSGAWQNIKAILGAAWDAIITRVTFGITLILAFFKNLGPNIVGALWNFATLLVVKGIELISGLWTGLVNKFWDVVGWLQSLPGAIIGYIGDMLSVLPQKGVDLVQGFINGIKSMAGAVGSAINSIAPSGGIFSGLPGNGGHIQMQQHAAGGIIDHPMLSWLGEGGMREVVIPMTRPARALELARQSGLYDMIAADMSGVPGRVATQANVGNSVSLNIESGAIQINGVNADDVAPQLEDMLRNLLRELQTR